jgi:hypothetical protein
MNVEIIEVSDCEFRSLIRQGRLTNQEYALIEACFVRSEERWIGSVDKVVACLWGLIPPTLLSDTAYLWLYNNELVDEHKFAFIRHSQVQMKRMLALYPLIVGDCLISNQSGRQWLKWLGAQFGPTDGPLVPFVIKAKAYG